MNKARLQIVAVIAIVLFAGGMLYLRMGPGSRGDIPEEARKVIQAAHDDAAFEDGGSAAIAERTGGTKSSRSGARMSSESEGDLQQGDADSSGDDPQISSKKKSSTRRKKGRKQSPQDDAREDDADAPKQGKKVTPSKTAS